MCRKHWSWVRTKASQASVSSVSVISKVESQLSTEQTECSESMQSMKQYRKSYLFSCSFHRQETHQNICFILILHICISTCMYICIHSIYICICIWYDMIWKHRISYHRWHVASQGHHLRFQFVPPCHSRLQWHRHRWHRWHRIRWCIRCHTWHHRCTICRMHYLHIRIRLGLNLIEFSSWRWKSAETSTDFEELCPHDWLAQAKPWFSQGGVRYFNA